MSTFIELENPYTADDYVRAARRRLRNTLFQGILLSLMTGFAYVAFDLDSLVLPVAAMLTVLLPLLLWHYPRLIFYLTFGSACLFELQRSFASDSITDLVPFFWNINTIFEQYAHFNPKAMPFSLFELLAIMSGLMSYIRGVYGGHIKLKTDVLFAPIAGYIFFVCALWLYGLATGGDFKTSLMEVRAQLYFLLAYLMVINTITERKQVVVLLWTFAICVAFKGILYTFRRHITMAGLPLPDQGVGSHEEAFFFNAFVILLFVLWLAGVHRKLQAFLWVMLPFVMFGNLATNRRAATAAFVIVIPIMLLNAYVSLPRRRKLALVLGLVFTVGGFAYYRAFRNSPSAFAQPARAIKSQFDPDERDRLSNLYRDAENANIMFNIKSNPLGFGYGKHMVIIVPMADISKTYGYWDIMPHNQVLWVWMRVGWPGFIAFWIMCGAIIIHAGQVLRRTDLLMESKALAMFSPLILIMLLLFGMYDLQLSNFRDMLFTGFIVGLSVVCTQPGISKHDPFADDLAPPAIDKAPAP